MKTTCVALLVLINVVFLASNIEAQLQVGYYNDKCHLAEFIVKEEIREAYNRDPGLVAGVLRMHFHDCFVRGCDGSVLIDSTPGNTAEKDSSINNPSLRGFDLIYNAKARIESVCKEVVSCADILAFAARDSVEITGGLGYDVPAGRRDGTVSLASETLSNLPPPTDNVSQLIQSFVSKGLTQEELVTLYGAHTLGRSHCTSFTSRLYNFSTTVPQDPSLDPNYAAMLKQQCPNPQFNNDTFLVVPMDTTPTVFDIDYYENVLKHRGLFTSDETLLTNSVTGNQIWQNVANPGEWESKFAAAMVKMGGIQVLTGSAGEIRADCRKINS